MTRVNYNTLKQIISTGNFFEVYGPKPKSYEFRQAVAGLNNKKLWTIIFK